MRARSMIAMASLAMAAAGCGEGDEKKRGKAAEAKLAPAISTLTFGPTATIREIMAEHVDVSGDFMFASVQDIADELGVRRKEPRTPDEWADVRENLLVLHDAPIFMVQPGRKAAKPGQRAEFAQVELQPEEIDKLLADPKEHAIFTQRAKRLQDAAAQGLKAVDAKDTAALFASIERVDEACESCHVRFWYPKDKAAVESAAKRGLTE